MLDSSDESHQRPSPFPRTTTPPPRHKPVTDVSGRRWTTVERNLLHSADATTAKKIASCHRCNSSHFLPPWRVWSGLVWSGLIWPRGVSGDSSCNILPIHHVECRSWWCDVYSDRHTSKSALPTRPDPTQLTHTHRFHTFIRQTSGLSSGVSGQ